MPIYEYHCEDCSSDFELLVRSDTRATCPKCEGERLIKKWSSFASGGEKGSVSSGGHVHSGTCGCGNRTPGACGLN